MDLQTSSATRRRLRTALVLQRDPLERALGLDARLHDVAGRAVDAFHRAAVDRVEGGALKSENARRDGNPD